MSYDLFAGANEKPADRVYTPMDSGDWDAIAREQAQRADETLVINMGPQHPATHGVLRLILECDGETVTSIRPGIGFLHTGIEKNMEFRNWAQGSAFVTRMDYVAPLFNEAVYCMAVERLLGIEDKIPERANIIRVLMMELNRISNHLVAIGTTGNELGATTVMMSGFREREMILDFFEAVSGLRMNHAYIRPGGVAVDLPENGLTQLRDLIAWLEKYMPEMSLLVQENPIFKGRTVGVGVQDLTACMALGVTGPILRSAGYAFDLRKAQPYCGYETYDFDVCTWDTADCYGRYRVRLAELWESLKIVKQCADRLEATTGQPVRYEDAYVGARHPVLERKHGQLPYPADVREGRAEPLDFHLRRLRTSRQPEARGGDQCATRLPTHQPPPPLRAPRARFPPGPALTPRPGSRPPPAPRARGSRLDARPPPQGACPARFPP